MPTACCILACVASHLFIPMRIPVSCSRHVRRFSPHVGHLNSFASWIRHVRRFGPHVGQFVGFVCQVRHVRRFLGPQVGRYASRFRVGVFHVYSRWKEHGLQRTARSPNASGERDGERAWAAVVTAWEDMRPSQQRGPTPPSEKKKSAPHAHFSSPHLAYRYTTVR